MNLQSKYRLERDKMNTFECEEYYFAYRVVEHEFQVHEIYIREDLRGSSEFYYDKVFKFISEFENIKYIVGYIYAGVIGSERSMGSMLKYGFKIYKSDQEKITLVLEVE